MTTYTFIDLFCGCGGFSYGFEQAGMKGLLGIDIWEDAIRTYRHNLSSHNAIVRDLTLMTTDDLYNQLPADFGHVDVIIGGPPCQGFSLSGKRLKSDPRNKLYESFVRFVRDIQPKVFVMENVPGLISLFGGRVKDAIIRDFTDAGYNVTFKILSAERFGVPQARKRVFFVGLNPCLIKNTDEFIFPLPTHGVDTELLPLVSTKAAISDLDFIPDDIALSNEIEYKLPAISAYQESMRASSEKIYNHVATLHKQRTKDIISLVPDGGNYKDLPESLQNTRKVNIAWTRMNSLMPCFTIDTGHNHHFHYSANRVPTVRESARIQSFPDDFIFLGIKTSQLKQVGNAVPPLLAKVIAERIIEILNKEG